MVLPGGWPCLRPNSNSKTPRNRTPEGGHRGRERGRSYDRASTRGQGRTRTPVSRHRCAATAAWGAFRPLWLRRRQLTLFPFRRCRELFLVAALQWGGRGSLELSPTGLFALQPYLWFCRPVRFGSLHLRPRFSLGLFVRI